MKKAIIQTIGNNINEEYKCEKCGSLLPSTAFTHATLKKNKKICKCCSWMQRNEQSLKEIHDWPHEDLFLFINLITTGRVNFVNELLSYFPYKNLKELCQLYQKLRLRNFALKVMVQCETCGKNIIKTVSTYLLNQYFYCCYECYYTDKPNKIAKGKDSKFYTKIETACTECGKPMEIIPSALSKTNSDGEHHHFCCNNCYYKFRSRYYVGEKSSLRFYNPSEEEKEKNKLKRFASSHSSNRFNTKPQLILNDLLDKMNIKYEREKVFGMTAVDNYLTEHDLIIEVMGDYWHGNPLKYNEEKYKLNKIQTRTILKDKQKRTYIKNHNHIDILYIWESDLYNNPNLCKKLIQLYIENNGILSEYWSFNYVLEKEELVIKKERIIPYQDMHSNQYNHLLNIS